MFEFLALVISVAAHAHAPAPSDTAAPDAPKQQAATAGTDAPPVFLAPRTGTADAPAAEAQTAEAQTAQAPPVFLAPAPQTETAAPPVFLTPAPAQTGQNPQSAPGLQAEPQIPTGRFTTATEVRPILTATKGNWISVRDFNGKDLVYVTHLWSWRCGLLAMKVGINGAPPQPWPLPPCHADEASPNAIKQTDGLPFAEFASGSVGLIEVHITFDDLSTDSARYNRQGVQIP